MMRSSLLGASALLAACSPVAVQADEPRQIPLAAPWDRVSFEMLSWGRPVTAWNILPDGSGGWNTVEDGESGEFRDYVTVWHEFPADPQSYGELATIIESLPFPAPRSEDCENFITDQPYGTLRLSSGSSTVELAYNAGCLDDDYMAFLDKLKAANELVAERASATPVMRRQRADGSWIETQ